MEVPTSRGPCLNQLRLVLDRCTNWSFEKRRMVGWLCLLSIGIFGVSPETRIPLECAKRVLDPEAFESYPWGRVACKSLMNSIKIASYTGKKSYTLCGLVHVLLIWAYEAIVGVRRIIRVRHFFPQLSDEVNPEWDDEVTDEEVDNLLEDLKHNRLDENAWDNDSDKNETVEKKITKQAKKRKDFYGVSAADKSRNMKKKVLAKEAEAVENRHGEGGVGRLDGAIDVRVDVRVKPVEEKMATIEKDIQTLKDLLQARDNNDVVNSSARYNNDVVNSSARDNNDVVNSSAHYNNDVANSTANDEVNSNDLVRLNSLLTRVTGLDGRAVVEKRQTKLSSTQLFPYVENSTVKRIIAGVIPSVAAYDPFAEVEESTLQRLLDFIEPDELEPNGTWDTNIEFYKIIITPREEWSKDSYGWLGDSHMGSTMLMFTKRSLRSPSPYHSARIAFLQQWFVDVIVRDYNSYDPKTWTIPEKYKGVFNGTLPADTVTNKKWLDDVDHLYACLHVNDNHWVALDIDLKKEKIHVYDCILGLVKEDKKMLEFCRPLAKMIPAILNVMVPATFRKKSAKQFTVKRLTKGIPQNDNPGDCGVYTLKYIECLALGSTFDGLSDTNIPEI
ncbi:unnamed protein product [Microthlaspi erraticum]|uniref:Ubiquitin-like protease family profile domain-containing protein n=1 Tax=Microthlaspi erraticum TaxID=1685480 RepID=A0A6D2JGP5_9BRAS|nr:unnamed protein product [Microthlaspi erraticum]